MPSPLPCNFFYFCYFEDILFRLLFRHTGITICNRFPKKGFSHEHHSPNRCFSRQYSASALFCFSAYQYIPYKALNFIELAIHEAGYDLCQ